MVSAIQANPLARRNLCHSGVVGLCLMSLEGSSKSSAVSGRIFAGWLLAAGVLLGWMLHFGILHAFLDASFIQGPAAKGPSSRPPGPHICDSERTSGGRTERGDRAAIWWRPLRRSKAKEGGYGREFAEGVSGWRSFLGSVPSRPIPGTSPLGLPHSRFPAGTAGKTNNLCFSHGSGLLLFYYSWRFLSRNLSRRIAVRPLCAHLVRCRVHDFPFFSCV